MQLLARLMDHVLSDARRAGDDRRRDLGRHRRRGGRGLPRARQCRRLHPLPGGPRLAVPAAADDDHRGRQRPRHRRQGHLRRLPGDREGHVRQPRASATGCRSPASTRSTGRGSSRRSSTTSPPRWRSARRSGRSPSPCRPAISATSSPAMPPSAWACRSTSWSIATNVNDILARTLATGRYELRGVTATASPSMDIQVSSNFERLLFEAYGRDAAAVRRLMGEPREQRRVSRSCDGPLAAIRDGFRRRPGGRGGDRGDDPRRPGAQTGFLPDPHTAVGLAVARRFAEPGMPMVTLATAHPAKFPDGGRAATGTAAGAVRPASRRSCPGKKHFSRHAQRSGGGRGIRRGARPRGRREGLKQ